MLAPNTFVAVTVFIILSAAIARPCAAAPNLTVLHDFTGGDGTMPAANLMFDTYGSLYGSCEQGGAAKLGAVFRLTPPAAAGASWTETDLHVFTGGEDGAKPAGNLIFDSFGDIYGVTAAGGPAKAGTVYMLAPPASPGGTWTETVLYQFAGGADGGSPSAGLVLDTFGSVYGVTEKGGANDGGTVFRLSPPAVAGQGWSKTALYNFRNIVSGGSPNGELIFDTSGALYGTTSAGPGLNRFGTVFRLTPPAAAGVQWTLTTLYAFTGSPDGASPTRNLIFDSFGGLYGTTLNGGPSNLGTVFTLTPASAGATWTETVIHSFAGSDGGLPRAGLVFDTTGALYGTTASGGASGGGAVFKLAPPAAAGGGWSETLLYEFIGLADGGQPGTSLALDGSGAVYGATRAGGSGKAGTVFSLMP